MAKCAGQNVSALLVAFDAASTFAAAVASAAAADSAVAAAALLCGSKPRAEKRLQFLRMMQTDTPTALPARPADASSSGIAVGGAWAGASAMVGTASVTVRSAGAIAGAAAAAAFAEIDAQALLHGSLFLLRSAPTKCEPVKVRVSGKALDSSASAPA